jgi:two-component system, cell cycle sensor histidine kinase and response regulator CckA
MDAQKPEIQAGETTRRPSVLLVEDDPGVAAVSEAWLRKLHWDVTVAKDGREAQKIAAGREAPLDLLVADVMLPGMRGPALAGAIRRHHHETAVLFTSGYSPELVSELFATHFDRALLIKKPYTKAQLEAGINVALARKGGAGAF